MQDGWSESQKEKVDAFLSYVDKKRDLSEVETRTRALSLFREYFRKLQLDLGRTPEVEEMFPVAPEIIIEGILKVNYLEPETISADNLADIASGDSEIAGLIDRENNKVVIAKQFKLEWRRFTAAHEIGHWLLHPNVIYLRERPAVRRSIASRNSIRLRERPVTGNELAYSKRTPEERQADLFAAELLMPTFHLVKTFFHRFGGAIDGTKPNEELAFWLSTSHKREIDAYDLPKWRLRDRSQLIAQVSSYGGRHFTPLYKRYGVSTTAMAIQLEDLGLVR